MALSCGTMPLESAAITSEGSLYNTWLLAGFENTSVWPLGRVAHHRDRLYTFMLLFYSAMLLLFLKLFNDFYGLKLILSLYSLPVVHCSWHLEKQYIN